MKAYQLLSLATLILAGCETEPVEPPPPEDVSAKPVTSTEKPEPLPAGKVFFITPLDGAKVFPDVDVNIGTESKDPKSPLKGKFWVLLGEGAAPQGTVLLRDATHTPFDRPLGEMKLAEGKHKLTVQLADDTDKSYGEALAQTIEIEVMKDDGERKVEILEPKDGTTVAKKFKIKFDVKGMPIRIAGESPNERITGHHHVLINLDAMDPGVEIPADKTHVHYGKGQTEAELELEPGNYKLTAQFADGSHRSYGKRMAHTVQVTVK